MTALQWATPRIKEMPFIFMPDGTVRVVKRLPLIFEDARPGREGRRADKALLNEPSVEELQRLFIYNRETGTLCWRVKPANHVKEGAAAGGLDGSGYRVVKIGDAAYRVHVICWVMANGRWPDRQRDHANGNKSRV